MKVDLVLLDDAAALERYPDLIRQQLEALWMADVRAFSPVLFAESSCLTQFVEEEIDFAVSSQQRSLGSRMTFDEFVAYWQWQDKLAMKVSALSGGWRKLLGLTLFVNRRCSHLLIVDLATHLSDQTIARFLQKTRALDIEHIAFAEYDNELLLPHLPDALLLKHSEQGLARVER